MSLISVLLTASCGGDEITNERHTGEITVPALLAQPLWVSRDAYDASHHLMVPLHAAFASGSDTQIQSFEGFFSAFLGSHANDLTTERLDQLHFLYFYTRYISLSLQRNGCVPALEKHYENALRMWSTIVSAPAWQWEQSDFPTLFDRVRWKLDTKIVNASYYRAIIDEDLFALAVGADLSTAARQCNKPIDFRFDLTRELAIRIYTDELTPTSMDGWVFQKGVWSDHPDYAHAGHLQLSENLLPAKVQDISPDSSHSFRQPLFLLSFACAEPYGSSARRHFEEKSGQLAHQVTSQVITMPSDLFRGIRLSNYMNGENGVYRYNHLTQGNGNGFGPFQLSGSFNLGWWSFLGQDLVLAYEAQRSSIPFGSTELGTYTGPNTTRTRNPEFEEPSFYKGRLIKSILDASLIVANTSDWCDF